MPRRRIVYLADTMVQAQMLTCLRRSFDVTLVTPRSLGDAATTFRPGDDPDLGRLECVELPGGRAGFPLRAARWLRRHRRRHDAVVVLDALSAALGANLGRALGGPPVVLQVGRPVVEYIDCAIRQHGPTPGLRLRRRVARWLIAFNEGAAAGVGTVSEYLAKRSANVGATAIHWQGVDLDRFHPGIDQMEARRVLGLPLDRPIVLWRSRLAPEKDLETFLDAVRLLRAVGLDVCPVVMGGEMDEVRARAAAYGVEILGRNASSPDEIPLWYAAADVKVQTSHAEGLGLSVLEALACGRPVVVTDTGGLPETVDGGRCGALVPPGDPRAVARAVARYLDDPAFAREHTDLGRRLVAERSSTEVTARAWRELVASVAEAGPARSARPPRVLFVDHQAGIPGGGERDMIDLARGLAAHPVELHAALPGDGPLANALAGYGVAVHTVPMSAGLLGLSRWDLARRPWIAARQGGAALATCWHLVRLIRRLDVEVVHSHSMKAHVLVAPAAALTRTPHVWHVKDILPAGWLHRAFTAVAGRQAARIVCISHAVARAFDGTAAARRAEVVHCGLRPDPARERAVAAARQRFGADPGVPLVGMVGHTARWKGHDVFVEAAALVAERHPAVRFAVVAGCTFPEHEGAFDAAVQRRVGELGLSSRLVWTDGVDDMSAAMASFDLLVHASRLPEPFGRVVVEAMAQGTPVIGTTLGAGPELVPPSAGRLVEPGDALALADAITALLDEPDKLAAMGEAAVAEARRFDISVAAGAFARIYADLVR